jgi:hypothetical protein
VHGGDHRHPTTRQTLQRLRDALGHGTVNISQRY